MFYVATVADGENEGEVVGWVHLDAPELDKLRHTAELTVGVREPYRKHGIGSRLLERAMAWANDAGYQKVYQSLPGTNETAIDLLEDFSWETEAVRKDHYLVGDEFVDEVMMARKLCGSVFRAFGSFVSLPPTAISETRSFSCCFHGVREGATTSRSSTDRR
ncbi:N-acetyltransferase family protein [Haladaptatus pallidirubidus]|uniref:N-acetyltransferase family protein n=1 Tax=Haladaptatus pallidirubidus TaxID=1008152 RepID=UPI00406B9F3C